MLSERTINAIKWDDNDLIPAIVQDATSKHVLMMAYMNKEALQHTLRTGETVFWSRSRQQIWHKGETSGNVQKVARMTIDCDADALLIEVTTEGPACHTGEITCFYRTLTDFEQHPVRE